MTIDLVYFDYTGTPEEYTAHNRQILRQGLSAHEPVSAAGITVMPEEVVQWLAENLPVNCFTSGAETYESGALNIFIRVEERPGGPAVGVVRVRPNALRKR